MASLIVLSTVGAIPMGNMNLFSDAIASEKHSDRYDNSQDYEKNYYSDNENNYRVNYDDYYYNQQQPSYNNNYDGYEDNKKYLMTIVIIMIITNIVITLQKTKNMSVKQDSLRASLLNQ